MQKFVFVVFFDYEVAAKVFAFEPEHYKIKVREHLVDYHPDELIRGILSISCRVRSKQYESNHYEYNIEDCSRIPILFKFAEFCLALL